MCEFCTQHGDGNIWYRNAANFSSDLVSDLNRRHYIEHFLESTIREGFTALGRLEALYRKKGKLPGSIAAAMVGRAKKEHFGQVLPIEEIRELVLRADTVVRMPCACRWTSRKKEARTCYGISYSPDAWYKNLDMSYFGQLPDDGLEPVGKEDAVRQMEELESGGAIHTIWTMVTPFIGAVCNCTAVDCLALMTLSGTRVELLSRAEHAAVVAGPLCTGCGQCAGTCPFGAVGSVAAHGRETAAIYPLKCFGCGLCRTTCPTGAISLVPRRGLSLFTD